MNNKHVKKFVNGEITRLVESVNTTMGKKLKDEYGKIPFEDFSKLRAVQSAIVACLTLATKFNVLEGAFDLQKGKQRKKFDFVEGLSRGLVHRFIKGKIFNHVLVELGLSTDNIMGNIVTSVKSSLQLLSLGKQSFDSADKFLSTYSKAVELYKQHTNEEEAEGLKVMLYTIHKAFPEQEEFNTFISNYDMFVKQAFEITVEDSIKMYLRLTEDDFTVIIDSLTLTGSRKGVDNTDAISFALELQDKFKKSYEDQDGFAKMLVNFVRQAVTAYSEDFKDEYEEIRGEIHTKQEQEKFIAMYESGHLFQTT